MEFSPKAKVYDRKPGKVEVQKGIELWTSKIKSKDTAVRKSLDLLRQTTRSHSSLCKDASDPGFLTKSTHFVFNRTETCTETPVEIQLRAGEDALGKIRQRLPSIRADHSDATDSGTYVWRNCSFRNLAFSVTRI